MPGRKGPKILQKHYTRQAAPKGLINSDEQLASGPQIYHTYPCAYSGNTPQIPRKTQPTLKQSKPKLYGSGRNSRQPCLPQKQAMPLGKMSGQARWPKTKITMRSPLAKVSISGR